MTSDQTKKVHIKAVIFDMDGLMIDTEKLYAGFWEKALQFYGYQPTKEFLPKLRSLSHELGEQLFLETFGKEIQYKQIRQKRIELMNAFIDVHGVEKKEGLDELLEYLDRKKIRMAVATATDLQRTTRYLTDLGLMKYFDEIVCGCMVENGKPAPDIYRKAIQLLGVLPKECIALEDSPNGVTSAFDAGCKVIMVPEYEDNSIDQRIQYDKVRSLVDVIGWIESNQL